VTPDFQIVEQGFEDFDTAYILGVRTMVDF
jgi:hypothetical protein